MFDVRRDEQEMSPSLLVAGADVDENRGLYESLKNRLFSSCSIKTYHGSDGDTDAAQTFTSSQTL